MTSQPEKAPAAAAEPTTKPAQETESVLPEGHAKPQAHDTAPPAALLKFMSADWKPSDTSMPDPIEDHEVFHARRRALSKLFPAETLIIPTGHEKVRANDTYFRFRPGSDGF